MGDDEGRREKLSNWLRKHLDDTYGNLANASRQTGVTYERLRKSLERNSFDIELLHALVSNNTIEQLRQNYDFRLRGGPDRVSQTLTQELSDTTQIDAQLKDVFNRYLRQYIKGVTKLTLEELAINAYGSLRGGDVSVLFYHYMNTPVEWARTNNKLTTTISSAIGGGASIFYVTDRNDLKDDTVEEFHLFANSVNRHIPVPGASETGMLALIGAPDPLFCTPYQKWSLYGVTENFQSGTRRAAYSFHSTWAIEDVNTSNSSGFEIVISQNREIVSEQLKVVEKITEYTAKAECTVETYPKAAHSILIRTLRSGLGI